MKKNLCFCKTLFAFFTASFLLLPLFISCEVGVGEALDLEAPHIEITSPKNNGYAAPSFDLIGYASDNHAVSDIEVQYTYRETKEGEKITKTKHTGMGGRRSGEWSCHLEFAFDQEISITVYAHDAMGNQSIESSDSIVVVIDSELPENGAILITRNSGFTTNTAKISKFLGEDGATAQRNIDSGNKDNFQNESITLSCNIKETYEISDVYLNLYEISNYKSETSYTKTPIKEKIKKKASSTNPFNPEFELTQSMLTGYSSSLRTGVHYIMPEIVAIDGAGNNSLPNSSAEPMVFAWEAEYDKPKVSLPLYYKDNLVKFPEGTKLPVILFDDDGLKSYSWTLQSKKDSKKKTGTEDISAKNLRDYNFEIDTEYYDAAKTQKIPDGDYTLTITVTDQITGMGGGRTEAAKTDTYNVKITNADAPTINITKPDFNSTPALTDKSKFTLEGASYDNGQVDDIAIAWCRDGNSKTAITHFESTFNFAANKGKKTESADKKLVIWNLDNITHTSSGAQYTDSFSKEFNIYDDFKNASGSLVNEPKTFVIAAKDATGNISTEVWRVGAFNSLPKFKITTSEESDFTGATTKTETQSMVTKIPERTLYVKIEPVSDLEITEFKVNGAACNATEIANGKIITITTPASDSKTAITYSAKDKLKNGGDTSTFTIQFDKVPEITNIFCNEEGETLNKGNLNFQVAFDKSVKVNGIGTAKLQIDCYKGNAKKETLYATYKSGSDTSTLYFEMPIPSGVEYDNVKVIKNGGSWIGLTNASIQRGEINANLGGNLAPNFNVIIDTKAPTITGYAGSRAGSNYTKTSGAVNIKMNFSEPVTAQNGYITIYRKGSEEPDTGDHSWHIPAVISEEVFEKIWNNSTTANRKVLCSSDTAMMVAGPDAYGIQSLVAKGPYKMYTNGIVENGSAMIPDLTTKYVLDWEYDTSGTAKPTGKDYSTAQLRAALEAVNYHKTTIPLSRLTFNAARTQATLAINDSDFIGGIREGVEYVMIIPTNAVVDDVQNVRTQTEHNTFTFSVGNTATPVIRVNRWSTNSNDALAPTGETAGKARVKIDCETPGAAIKYRTLESTLESESVKIVTTTSKRTATAHPSKSKANIDSGTESSYSAVFYVGDGKDTTGQRIFMSAYATSSIANMQASSKAYECAYKTVIKYKNTKARGGSGDGRLYTGNQFKILACQTTDGSSWTAGWPLTMRQRTHETDTAAATRDGHKLATKSIDGADYTYTWISWELVFDKEFITLVVGENYQRTSNTTNSGEYVYGDTAWTWAQ